MTESLEDYLEAIYLLIQDKKVARVKDVSDRLSVKKPSVIHALKELEGRNLISHEKYGYIDITETGLKEAENIVERHNTLKKFLTEILEVSPAIAEQDACKMEHVVSQETLDKIRNFVKAKCD